MATENLLALKQAEIEAKAAYHGHHYSGPADDIAALVAFDLEERHLQRLYRAAEDAYADALEAHVAASKQAAE